MADLESLIDARLAANATLTALLATFNGQPAVLLEPIPADVNRQWSAAEYPRVEWRLLRQQVPERKIEGQALFDVFVGPTEDSETLEAVERALIAALDGSIYHPDIPAGEPVESLRWSNSIEIADQQGDDLIHGKTISFDLFAFPAFTAPQVAALNAWTLAEFSGQVQVNPASWAPDMSTPAVYWRLESAQPVDTANALGIAMQGVLVGHILEPANTVGQMTWTQAVAERLATAIRLPLASGSKLVLRGRPGLNLAVDLTADPMRRGQLRQTARWWVPLQAPATDAALVESIHGTIPESAVPFTVPAV